ncbi:RADC family protein [Pochonia chlamydosporia 170]|uniref:RADC family protein n=1 Tax=Pochonia chlamydosporia 170 TaxID=1380566 RepID=A0A179FPT2_METCM|nr:RADC family protein [Pochonia chlamydosporia 170]OAQ67636.1 RADC family protein [Pochonia chlamydosporia 170]
MSHHSYTGSGPYCYANSFAMMMGADAPSTAVIEFATCSPFGMEVIGKELVFFDPYAWDPMQSFEDMLVAAGWTSKLTVGKDADDALASLKKELEKGPVFVGPVEMGYLRYQPGNNGPMGADHYVVVLGIEGDRVDLHDPQGFPYATIPVSEFLQSWKTDSLGYGKSYMMRSEFKQIHKYTEEEIIRRTLPNARKWLSMAAVKDSDMPPGSCGNAKAAERLAEIIQTNFHPGVKNPLVYFAVRVGVRRLADAATCLERIGETDAAGIMAKQARLVGALQYPLVVGDKAGAVKILKELGPTYDELRAALK